MEYLSSASVSASDFSLTSSREFNKEKTKEQPATRKTTLAFKMVKLKLSSYSHSNSQFELSKFSLHRGSMGQGKSREEFKTTNPLASLLTRSISYPPPPPYIQEEKDEYSKVLSTILTSSKEEDRIKYLEIIEKFEDEYNKIISIISTNSKAKDRVNYLEIINEIIKKFEDEYNKIISTILTNSKEEDRIKYLEIIEKFYEKKDGPKFIIFILHLLLTPEQKQFRQDFLIAFPCIEDADDKQESKLLFQEMEKVLKNPLSTSDQKRTVLEVAIQLIERGVLEKEDFSRPSIEKTFVESEKTFKECMLTTLKSDHMLLELVMKFTVAHKLGLKKASEINYSPKESNGFLGIKIKANSKSKKLSKKGMGFIKHLIEDIHSLTSNSIKMIHFREFYGKAWSQENKEEMAPNLTYATFIFNQIHQLLLEQILNFSDENDLNAFCLDLFQATQHLIKKHHNYQAANIINSVLNSFYVSRLISEDIEKQIKPLNDLFDPTHNFKKLKEEMKNCENKRISYLPFLGLMLSEFTFIMDGNANYKEEGKINIEKLQMIARFYHQLEKIQQSLQVERKLYFNPTTILGSTFTEEQAEKASGKIKPIKAV